MKLIFHSLLFILFTFFGCNGLSDNSENIDNTENDSLLKKMDPTQDPTQNNPSTAEPVEQREFITIWKVRDTGDQWSNQLTILTDPDVEYDYSIDWGDDSELEEDVTTDITHTYKEEGEYTVKIKGQFPHFYCYGDDENNISMISLHPQDLLSVEQWGDMHWKSMQKSFQFCGSVKINALDAPNLSEVTDMSYMFAGSQGFNSPIDHWDVSNITNMSHTFSNALQFNQPIGNWDTSKVITMQKMFGSEQLSLRTGQFNQAIGNWDTSKVTDMSEMFVCNTEFNQPIGNWDVSKVTTMQKMFWNFKLLDKSSPFNQAIGHWDTSNVTDMNGMFGASGFNQDISVWNVSNVTNMGGMFAHAYKFDQNISAWDVTKVVDFSGFLNGTSLSTTNYDALLEAWSQLEVQTDLEFNAGDRTFCTANDARNILIHEKNWDINDGSRNCQGINIDLSNGVTLDSSLFEEAFVTVWQTDLAERSNPNTIQVFTDIENYEYDYIVDWGDGTFDENVRGNIEHYYAEAGTYTVKIAGTFPHFRTHASLESGKSFNCELISVEKWGNQVWKSMNSSYANCDELVFNAIDAPDLSEVTDMSYMFAGARWGRGFNSALNHWDVSNVTTMSGMLGGTYLFNQPLDNWNTSKVTNMEKMFSGTEFNQDISMWEVSNVTKMNGMFASTPFNQNISMWNVAKVTNMAAMFSNARAFNQPLNNWSTSEVTDMKEMFRGTEIFNQPLNNWNTSKVTNFYRMFNEAKVFNQPLNTWDTSKVTDMKEMFWEAENFNQPVNQWDLSSANRLESMFAAAISFDQSLAAWDVSNVDNLDYMLIRTGLSPTNYDATLTAWSQLDLPEDVTFYAFGLTYCEAEAARSHIINNFGWEISDSGLDCRLPDLDAAELDPLIFTNGFITKWKTDNRGVSEDNAIFIHANANNFIYDYSVDWGDGTFSAHVTSEKKHVYPEPGIYTVKIVGDFPHFASVRFETRNTGSGSSFSLASRVNDAPKLIEVLQWGDQVWQSMQSSFQSTNLVISATDIPNLSEVTNMESMFKSSNFTVSNINGWDVSNVTDMSWMFNDTDDFDQPLDQWDVSNVTNMTGMFGHSDFNQSLNQWDVSNVTNMSDMFFQCKFNQDISSWDVSNVTNMESMFGSDLYMRTAFNQSLGAWDMSSVENIGDMFSGVNFSVENYDATLIGWSTQNLVENLTLDVRAQYCQGAQARQSIIDNFNWTINDSGQRCP